MTNDFILPFILINEPLFFWMLLSLIQIIKLFCLTILKLGSCVFDLFLAESYVLQYTITSENLYISVSVSQKYTIANKLEE